MTTEQEKWLDLILDGLEGKWVYKGIWEDGHILDFKKPTDNLDWSEVIEYSHNNIKPNRTLQYNVLIDENNIVWLTILVKTADQKIPYRILVDFMNSFIGDLFLTDHLGNKLNYARLEPRIVESH